MLSLIALASALALAVVLAGSRLTASLAPARRFALAELGPYALPVAWMVALVATLGSLFMSEVAGFVPCMLCWVQRGFMYPLVVVLGVASLRHSRWTARVIPWVAVGGSVSILHIAEERLPGLFADGLCDPAVPCSLIWVNHFGFVTIPFMALTGFGFIATLMWLDRARSNREGEL
jgi:disulfide bond formation protein DsbB